MLNAVFGSAVQQWTRLANMLANLSFQRKTNFKQRSNYPGKITSPCYLFCEGDRGRLLCRGGVLLQDGMIRKGLLEELTFQWRQGAGPGKDEEGCPRQTEQQVSGPWTGKLGMHEEQKRGQWDLKAVCKGKSGARGQSDRQWPYHMPWDWHHYWYLVVPIISYSTGLGFSSEYNNN